MRRPLAALAAVLALLTVVPAARARPVLGIADDNPAALDDPRLKDLRLDFARINIPWDVLADRTTLPRIDAWMRRADEQRYQVLISFDRSRRPGHQGVNPSNARIASTLRAWRRRWGPRLVHTISTWNEPNINKQPRLVAGWYLALTHACPSCTVLPGELVDRGNDVSYAHRVDRLAGRTPKIWGLHSYIDVNTLSTRRIRAFAREVPGDIWITEAMGVVARKNSTVPFKGTGVAFQTQATQFLLSQEAAATAKLHRIYLYSWSAGTGPLTFDSGLTSRDGATGRPALNVVRAYLGLPADPLAISSD